MDTFRSVAFAHVAGHGSSSDGQGDKLRLYAQKDAAGFVIRSKSFLGYMVKRLSAHGGCLGSKRR